MRRAIDSHMVNQTGVQVDNDDARHVNRPGGERPYKGRTGGVPKGNSETREITRDATTGTGSHKAKPRRYLR